MDPTHESNPDQTNANHECSPDEVKKANIGQEIFEKIFAASNPWYRNGSPKFGEPPRYSV
jgi:hypothetical protein